MPCRRRRWRYCYPAWSNCCTGGCLLPDVNQAQLRARSWWSGPDIYVVVDDYDLVATSAGNPLLALLEYLPHAEDLGLHLIVARRSGGAARALFEPLLAGLA